MNDLLITTMLVCGTFLLLVVTLVVVLAIVDFLQFVRGS